MAPAGLDRPVIYFAGVWISRAPAKRLRLTHLRRSAAAFSLLMLTNNSERLSDIDRIRCLLDEGKPQQALDLVNRRDQDSAEWRNARGVCLLRLGKVDEAAGVLREVVFPDDSIAIPDDMPSLYRANFATAMLLKRNLVAGIPILRRLNGEPHPYIRQLSTALARWDKSLNFVQRLLGTVEWYPDKPFPLDFPPGAV
jgi:hypothetical protein